MQTIWMTCQKMKSNTIVCAYRKRFPPKWFDCIRWLGKCLGWTTRHGGGYTSLWLACCCPVDKKGKRLPLLFLKWCWWEFSISDVESTQISRRCCRRRRRKKKKTGHAHAILWAHPGDNITKSLNTKSQKKKGNAEWGHEKFWLRRSLTACCCCCCVTVYYIVFYFFNRKTKRQNREKNFKRKKKKGLIH